MINLLRLSATFETIAFDGRPNDTAGRDEVRANFFKSIRLNRAKSCHTVKRWI